jgi:hypothetical protein
MERKNDLHLEPFEMLYEYEDFIAEFKNISKKIVKKVDAAISYSPIDSEDPEFKVYLLLCEAKKPDATIKMENKDYDKLVRLIHDCFNSFIIYYSKKAKYITKTLRELFNEFCMFGLHIHGNF